MTDITQQSLQTAESISKALAQWLGWAKHSNSRHLLKTIIKPQYYASIL